MIDQMKIRPYLGTLGGLVLGLFAISLWAVTFQPHGGVELSSFLLPASRPVFDRLYPNESVPVFAWFGFGVVQWVIAGTMVDLIRWFLCGRSQWSNAED
jgi:hypothetical protein